MTKTADPDQLISSIYLGDRACKAVLIDSWNERVGIQVDFISRVRPGSATWDSYTDEDIADAWLVFTGVQKVVFDPPGPLPDDYIGKLSIIGRGLGENRDLYAFQMSVALTDKSGSSTEVFIRILAGGMHLEDPSKPGLEVAWEKPGEAGPPGSNDSSEGKLTVS